MKSDQDIAIDVLAELRWDPSVKGSEIGVGVKEGVVTLSGTVVTFAQKYAAARAVEGVYGVRAIADDLVVRSEARCARSDTDLAHMTLCALERDVEVPDEQIQVTVDDGWIVLEGSVDWRFQRDAAERAVRYLSGVQGMTNRIAVRPRSYSTEVKAKIEAALRRSAEVDSHRVVVDSADGLVTLRGTVRSRAERMDAERAAWNAPGVREVHDHIEVSG